MLLSNTLRYALARGLSGLCSFLALAVFARLLGPRGYGHYALTIASVGFAYAALYQWLSLATVRLLKSNLAPPDQFLAAVRRAFLRVTVGVLGGLALVFAFGPRQLPRVTLVLGCALLLGQAWLELNLMLATAEGRPVRYGQLTVSRAIGSLVFGGALAAAGFGPEGVLLGVWLSFLAPGLWVAAKVWSLSGPPGGTVAIEARLLRYGAPLVATYLLDYVISASDRVMIGALRGTAAVGTYSASYDLTQQTIWTLMMVVNLAAYPMAVAAIERGDQQAFRGHCRRHLGMLLGIALPAGAGLAVLAPGIAALVLGGEFVAEAARLLPIIALAIVLGGLKAYYFDLSFQLGQSTIHQLAVVAVAALLNLGLNAVWIPQLGAQGAALATLTAYAVGLLLSAALGRRVLPLPVFLPDVIRILLATACMVGLLWPFRQATSAGLLAVQVAAGGMVYFAVLVLLNPADLRTALVQWWRSRSAEAGL